MDIVVFGMASLATFGWTALRAARSSASRSLSTTATGATFHVREAFGSKLARLLSDGPNSLQLIVDFDRTLTTSKSESAYGVIEENQPDDVRKAARDLYHYYHAIEVDPKRSIAEKTPFMMEWYEKAHELLAHSKISKATMESACKDAPLSFRPEVAEVLRVAKRLDVPVMVFSAGIANVIRELFKQLLPADCTGPHLHVVSNQIVWGEDGTIAGWEGDLIHMFNKNESHLRGSALYPELLRRRNVLLVGDSLGDVSMADGLPHENIVRIGIVNGDPAVYLQQYLKAFDAVVADGTSFAPVLDILQRVEASAIAATAAAGGAGVGVAAFAAGAASTIKVQRETA